MSEKSVKLGSGKFIYEEVEGWAQLPPDWDLGEVPGIAVDSQDRVYAFCRSEHPVVVFERDGRFLGSWGEGMFVRPHMILIGPDDAVYCVDDEGHRVHKCTTDGKLLMTIAPQNGVAETGYVPPDWKTVQRGGPPFNRPTDVALSPEGDIYVSDGYGNARVHKFTAEGRLLRSWGEPGDQPGQFHQPHCVFVDRQGRVYVGDRQNQRIQIFSAEGEFLTQWNDIWWPDGICQDAEQNLYVGEVGGIFMFGQEARLDQRGARITVRDLEGNVQSEWGEEDPHGAGRFFAPHGVALDSRGDLYVGEVTFSYSHRQAPPDAKVLRKYARV